jgi:glucose-1-phosphate adenylyltransferase
MHDVLTLILGGGRGRGLYPLTKGRSEPAVPVAGNYRLIDIPVSNAINSGLSRIYVLTQFLSVSLHRHIGQTYKRDAFSQGFIEVLPAQQTNEATAWYQGTADAIRHHLRYIQEDGARDVLILSGDQLYRMDFGPLVQGHRDSNADVTMAVLPVSRDQAGSLGIVCADEQGHITRLVEKPQTDDVLDSLRTPSEWFERRRVAAAGRELLANMGIYVVNRQVLFDCLSRQPSATDLVTEVFAGCLPSHRVQVHLYDGYWQDLGTIKSYFEANLAVASDQPPFDFHSPEGVIYTRMRFLPASRISAARLEHCLISDGCVVSPGARLERCVVGVRSRIGRNVTLRDAVMLGANHFENESDDAGQQDGKLPPLGIGDDSVLERVIIDKNCRIGRGVQIVNRRGLQQDDGENYVIRDGIVVIPNGAVVHDGTVI